jgi:hypothetical protein
MLMLLAMGVFLALITSTSEGRAEARQRLKPIGRLLLIPTLLLWAALLWPFIRRAF